jgi:LCP family protein required for cell wall assembly
MKKEKKLKKKRTPVQKAIRVIAIILLVVIIILAGVAIAGWTYIRSLIDQTQKIDIDVSQIEVNENLKGYRNIALLGIDSRASNVEDAYSVGNRSDCIMIASINQETNDVKLISVYRDSYLKINNKSGNEIIDKVTHAYAYGGPQNTLLALNRNLDLNIKEFMAANFDAVSEAVDALGGIEIEITSAELKYINAYVNEINGVTGRHSPEVTKTGLQTLDGVQATAYGRIRYTAGGDYKRTERMRDVLQAMLIKAKKLSIPQLIDLANKILPLVSTNLSTDDVIALAPVITKINITTSTGWPYTVAGATIGGVWYGVPTTLESNVVKLHKEVFGEEDYVLPDKIKSISQEVINKSGKTEGSGAETNSK